VVVPKEPPCGSMKKQNLLQGLLARRDHTPTGDRVAGEAKVACGRPFPGLGRAGLRVFAVMLRRAGGPTARPDTFTSSLR
jgi:hypothetical protein